MYRGISVKILNIKGSYISMKYNSSNSTTRVKKTKFIEDYEKGVYTVTNPSALPEELRTEEVE